MVNGDEVVMKFCKEGASISTPIDRDATYLPVVHNSFVSEKVKREHASKFRSALHATGLYAALDYFANMSVDQICQCCQENRVPFPASHVLAV